MRNPPQNQVSATTVESVDSGSHVEILSEGADGGAGIEIRSLGADGDSRGKSEMFSGGSIQLKVGSTQVKNQNDSSSGALPKEDGLSK